MLDLGPENSLSFIQFLKNGFIIFGVISSFFTLSQMPELTELKCMNTLRKQKLNEENIMNTIKNTSNTFRV